MTCKEQGSTLIEDLHSAAAAACAHFHEPTERLASEDAHSLP